MLKVHAKNLETVAVIYLEGRIVAGETEPLRNSLPSFERTSTLILDLTRVSTVDAHGLGVLLQIRERALTNGARFKLTNMNKPIRQVFEITHLDSVFQILPSTEFVSMASNERRASVAA